MSNWVFPVEKPAWDSRNSKASYPMDTIKVTPSLEARPFDLYMCTKGVAARL